MLILALIGCFLVALGSTAFLVPQVRKLANEKGWVDNPDGHRKLHKAATPSVGGIAISAGFVLGFTCLIVVKPLLAIEVSFPSMAVWLGSIIMVMCGLYDDTKGMGFKGKFCVQLIVAYLLLHAGYRIDVSGLPFVEEEVYSQAVYSIPLTVLWIVGVINAVNLLDGVDGLAAGVVLIAFVFLSVVFGLQGELGLIVTAVAISGALIGFLVYNFSPASIFMGDSGSLFLGFLLAAYSLEGKISHSDPWLAILVPLLILGLPLLDTLLSVVRRFSERRAIFAPDHDHIHHRLLRIFPTRYAVLVLYGVSLFFGGVGVVIVVVTPMLGYSVFATTLFLVGLGLAGLGYVRSNIIGDYIFSSKYISRFRVEGSGVGGEVMRTYGVLDKAVFDGTSEINEKSGSVSGNDFSIGSELVSK